MSKSKEIAEEQLSVRAMMLIGIGLLSLLLVIGVAAYAFLNWVLTGINAQVGAAFIGALATVFVSVYTIVLAKRADQRAAISAELRSKKKDVYSGFLGQVLPALSARSLPRMRISLEDLHEDKSRFTDLVTWASSEVLSKLPAVNAVMRMSIDQDAAEPPDLNQLRLQLLGAVNELIVAMRRDLGHTDEGVNQLADVFQTIYVDEKGA